MTYQVLSRKWRPQKFEDVVGQQHVAATLQNSIKQDRLAHAYLFSGPRGVGKTTTARILAKYLNCKNPQGVNPCNECKNCREITSGRSFDVLEIDGASNNGVENIRELREAVKYPPTDGNYRIYIIDEVHMLSTPAFNALLKTLEEPPDHVKFVFATTEPEALLPTIISRTQRFDFKRISVPKIVELLTTICESENIHISNSALNLIARKADGSMRDAESLLDQVISFSGTDISDDDVASLLGLVDYELYIRLSKSFTESDISGVLALTQEVIMAGYDLKEFLNGMSDYWRNILVLKSTEDKNLMDVPDSYHHEFMQVAKHYEERDLIRLLNLSLSAQQQFKYVRNQKIFIENFLLKLTHFDQSVSLDQIVNRTGQLAGGGKETENPNLAPKASGSGAKVRRNIGAKRKDYSRNLLNGNQPARIRKKSGKSPKRAGIDFHPDKESPLPGVNEFQSRWRDFIDFVSDERGPLSIYLKDCAPEKTSGKILVLLFDHSKDFSMKRIADKSDAIEKLIQKFYGVKVRLKCQAGDTGQEKKEQDDDEIIDDPITQAIINQFDGEIVR